MPLVCLQVTGPVACLLLSNQTVEYFRKLVLPFVCLQVTGLLACPLMSNQAAEYLEYLWTLHEPFP